ncbi:hypothetical protein FXO38_29078 [Capsicum annuum]|nr:hypothetical protein FXO38_29078 [Capsicum annuum]
MAQHANCTISVSGNKSMDLVSDERPSFSLGLTQDEVFNLGSSNIQPKGGVSSEGARLKHCKNPKNIVEKMKRKGLRKPSSPKPQKIQKSMKKAKPDEKGECSKISSPVSSDFDSEEEKVKEDDFVFDEDLSNRIIEDYFGGANYSTATFDLVESGRYSDYPWGLVDNQILRLLNWKTNTPRSQYESLMESMFNDADVKVSFKNIKPTRKEISCFRIPKKVVPAGVLQEMKSIHGLVSTRCDEIMNAISEIKKKDKDNLVDNPPMGEADKTTHHEFTLNFVHDLYKNSKGTLVTEEINENQSASLMEVYNEDKDDVLNTKLIDDNISEAHISYSQFSFSDEVIRNINLDFIKFNLGVEDESMDKECDAEKILNLVEFNEDNSKLNQQNQFPVHIHVALIEERKAEQKFSDSQVTIPDELLPSLNAYLNQERMPWYTIDHIFIPINIKDKHLWILAAISFNDRCIYVYDSLSSIVHDVGVLVEVEKLAEVIPICLVACKFYEKKGIDTVNHSNYKSYDKMNLFDVYVVDDLPQQASGNLDCGLYMMTYAECLTFGDLVSPVDFDPDLIRTRYSSIL